MKICLVTAFPPSRRGLSEYGFHIARELNQQPGLSLTILGDDLPANKPELPGFSVRRCWGFDSLISPVRLLRAIKQERPDVVWYNIGFASFGGKALPAFVGLFSPALTRLRGCYTHVTLHQLVETVDLKDAGVNSPTLYRVAGALATHMLLSANSLSVLLPAYRRVLQENYRRGSVFVRGHGVLSGRPEYPDFSQRGNPVHRILAFGKWGTYKRLELLLSAFHMVAEQVPNVELVIAGGDHPKTPGYLASVAKRIVDHSQIKFAGYVPEKDLSSLFQSTSVTVMPYSSSAGSSGVAHLACAYGVPIVGSDIADLRELVEEEELAIELFEPGNEAQLAALLVSLLQSPDRLEAMAKQNFSAALRMSMPEIIRQYIRSFDLQHRLKVLRAAARFRRLPRWMPLRPMLSRRVGRRFLTWHDSEFAPQFGFSPARVQPNSASPSLQDDQEDGASVQAVTAKDDATESDPLIPIDGTATSPRHRSRNERSTRSA